MACSSSSLSWRFSGNRARHGCLLFTAALGLTVAAVSSCSHDSYLKVTLLAANNEITDIARVVVSVRASQASASAWLDYTPSQPISFDTMAGKTFSISFTPSQSGTMILDVGVLNARSECVGSGTASALIKRGDVTAVIVSIAPNQGCPLPPDAGVGMNDAGSNADGNSDTVTFPGCDPANPGGSCKANQTCFVNCAASKGECLAAGTKGPGEACTVNTDCIPGTQCFDYGGLPGCGGGTRICQKFCSSDVQCSSAPGAGGGTGGGSTDVAGGGGTSGAAGRTDAAGGAGGAAATDSGAALPASGTGGQPATAAVMAATCRNPVVCSANVTTSYRTCSFACDPRGNATLGCPSGLLCFLYKDSTSGKDSPDCGCREPSRTGTDGMACTSSTNCAPGFICNSTGATQVCRKLCQLTSPTDCTVPKTCNALTNTAFGVCTG